MDLIDLIPDQETRAAVGTFLVFAGVCVPLLRKLAAKTSNLVDDRIVELVDKALAFVPRVKIGK